MILLFGRVGSNRAKMKNSLYLETFVYHIFLHQENSASASMESVKLEND